MIKTTNKTKLLGIIGTPVEHTLSPKMHSFLAERCGVDVAYLAFDVPDGGFRDAVFGAKNLGALGFNITSPYKVRVMEFLDEIDEEAARMGSVNTIVNHDGKWFGYNTDGAGFVGSLLLEGHKIEGKHILLLGAGGSARSVAYCFAKENAASITISARNEKNICAIGEVIAKYTQSKFYGDLDTGKRYDFIVNTTPVGMHPMEGRNPFLHMELVDTDTVCCDLIYNPKRTQFLLDAVERGASVVNDLGMLVLQGIYAFEHFTKMTLDKSLYKELLSLLGEYAI